jgi:hypothetical protein
MESEIRLVISKSISKNNTNLQTVYDTSKNQIFQNRINLIKTLKIYAKKYCDSTERYKILYLSILYLDIIISKNKINLSIDKNLKFLCLCCFLISIKFIGNFDISKKVVMNFCKNYREDYKYYEHQCLMILENNLVYTTAYDYLEMIFMEESKNEIFLLCNSLLYEICEQDIYMQYSPFYIAIAIFHMVKDNSKLYHIHNPYETFFKDDCVKAIVKKLNHNDKDNNSNKITPQSPPKNKNKINLNDKNWINKSVNNLKKGTNPSPKLPKNINSNTNINSQKRNHHITIINKFSTPIKLNLLSTFTTKHKKKDINFTEKNFDSNKYYKGYINRKNYTNNKNSTNIIFKMDSNKNVSSRIYLTNYNNHKTIVINQSRSKDKDNNNKNRLIFLNSYCKKNARSNNKIIKEDESISTSHQTPDSVDQKKKVIFPYKSSALFQSGSRIQKGKLVELSYKPSRISIKYFK